MAGLIINDPIEKSDGSPVDLTGQHAAKGFGGFQGASPTLEDSLNVSSLVDDGAGQFTANWTTAFATTGYSFLGACQFPFSASAGGWSGEQTKTVNAGVIRTGSNGASSDRANTTFQANGDLA